VARVTYFAEGSPRSGRTWGLVKVGTSRDPERRARSLSARLLGTTTLTEGEIRPMLAPFAVPRDEIAERRLEHPREWYRDTPEVRVFVRWACRVHPADDALAASGGPGVSSDAEGVSGGSGAQRAFERVRTAGTPK
jgi:hypothetical protein